MSDDQEWGEDEQEMSDESNEQEYMSDSVEPRDHRPSQHEESKEEDDN
jgi:hypothetical protein